MNIYEEAYETITRIILDQSSNGYDSPKTVEDFFHKECGDLKELVELATPKKPIMIDDGAGFGDQVLSCPHCKKPIMNVWSVRSYEPNYCQYCGQALDHEKARSHAMAIGVDMAAKNTSSITLDHNEIARSIATGIASALQFSIGNKK